MLMFLSFLVISIFNGFIIRVIWDGPVKVEARGVIKNKLYLGYSTLMLNFTSKYCPNLTLLLDISFLKLLRFLCLCVLLMFLLLYIAAVVVVALYC